MELERNYLHDLAMYQMYQIIIHKLIRRTHQVILTLPSDAGSWVKMKRLDILNSMTKYAK